MERQLITMRGSSTITSLEREDLRDGYHAARSRLTEFLTRHCLVGSYTNFRQHGKSYPFVEPGQILPGQAAAKAEYGYQNTALIFLLDEELPRGLNKHFRLRGSNRVSWRNLQRIAGHMDFSDYMAAHCRLDSPDVENLLTRLCSLDYALLIGRPPGPAEDGSSPYAVTHMHVKVERLTDNAIKELARTLGYIDHRLFERGEDYVDILETKFYEYYGFPANASGRRSAAAIAAQLFAKFRIKFSVFVASSEDSRLAIIDDSELLSQYLLLRAGPEEVERFGGNAHLLPFVLFEDAGCPVLLYRVRFRHTGAAQPMAGRRNRSLDEPWLEIADEMLLSPAAGFRTVLPVSWASGQD